MGSAWVGPFSLVFAVLLLVACTLEGGIAHEAEERPLPAAGSLELSLLEQGLVDVQSLDPTIRVALKYVCDTNFMGVNVYGDLTRGYLRREVALMLKHANQALAIERPGLSLLLLDGARPRHVQHRMWKLVKDTPMRKYVANPYSASMHNYGVAVDITIADENGVPLDMGTPPDYFGELAEPRLEQAFLRQGRLTAEQVANRQLLRRVMTNAGFRPLAIEWWHFDAFDKEFVRRTYSVIE
jgi:zinc D-Ala-D-Ala dipeptidase